MELDYRINRRNARMYCVMLVAMLCCSVGICVASGEQMRQYTGVVSALLALEHSMARSAAISFGLPVAYLILSKTFWEDDLAKEIAQDLFAAMPRINQEAKAAWFDLGRVVKRWILRYPGQKFVVAGFFLWALTSMQSTLDRCGTFAEFALQFVGHLLPLWIVGVFINRVLRAYRKISARR